jgi:hypothetical protein
MQSWDVEQIEKEVDQLDKKRDFLETGVRRPSAYVDVFESAFPFCEFSIVLTLFLSYGQNCSRMRTSLAIR